jgi:uncharacterized integral membrane protein (TIGR00698 family)
MRGVALGVGLLVVGALLARGVGTLVPLPAVLLAIALGIALGNAVGVPEWASAGVGTHTLWLEVGIVLVGATVPLDRVLGAGPAVGLVLVTVLLTVLVVELLARLVFAVDRETGSLLAAGAGVCGVSAVVAVAESIDADETTVAYAATTVLLFDSLSIAVYPLVGAALGLSDTVFGVWAGLTMLSTGPVTAVGFSVSETAGQWAVLVKLVRNTLIGVAAVAYAAYYTHRRGDDALLADPGRLYDTFPKFVVGFLLVLGVANAGLVSEAGVESLSNAADWLFLVAFVGLGADIDLADLQSAGGRPALVLLTGVTLVATVSLPVVALLF